MSSERVSRDAGRRWVIRKRATSNIPYDTYGASIIGPATEPVEVVPVPVVEAEMIEQGARALFQHYGNGSADDPRAADEFAGEAKTVLRAALEGRAAFPDDEEEAT